MWILGKLYFVHENSVDISKADNVKISRRIPLVTQLLSMSTILTVQAVVKCSCIANPAIRVSNNTSMYVDNEN